jgi:hypothetical protein
MGCKRLYIRTNNLCDTQTFFREKLYLEKKYIAKILKRFSMHNSKLVNTPPTIHFRLLIVFAS